MKPLQKLAVVVAVLATLGLPWLGAILKWRPNPIPGFGVFQPQQVLHPPPFWGLYFGAACCVALVMLAFLLVPQWFGFKPAVPPPPFTPGSYPAWFYVGAVICLASWYVMWFTGSWLVKYLFTAQWWGFIA